MREGEVFINLLNLQLNENKTENSIMYSQTNEEKKE